MLNLFERSKYLLIVLPSSNNLQVDRHIGVFLRAIEVVVELVVRVLGDVV